MLDEKEEYDNSRIIHKRLVSVDAPVDIHIVESREVNNTNTIYPKLVSNDTEYREVRTKQYHRPRQPTDEYVPTASPLSLIHI